MFNDTIQSADLSEENKGAAEQEDLPCFSRSINHSEKLGWLAVQMSRPLGGRGGWQTPGILHFLLWWCSTWNLAVNVHRNRMGGCSRANADGAEAVRGFCQTQMGDEENGEWGNLLPNCLSSALEPEVKPLTEEVWFFLATCLMEKSWFSPYLITLAKNDV